MNYKEREKLMLGINNALQDFDKHNTPLPGIQKANRREALSRQIVDSIARVEYVYTIADRDVSPHVCSPNLTFDPLKAAILFYSKGEYEEACWQVFLAINFGKHVTCGWLLAREIYGAITANPHWTWKRVSADPSAFSDWLKENHRRLEGRFGNHRKYESLDPSKKNHTGVTIETYVNWAAEANGHHSLISKVLSESTDSRDAFAKLYKSMSSVRRFGRTAIFDYLTMLSKLGLAELEPDKAYISGSTGPKSGINLLINGQLGSSMSSKKAEQYIRSLGDELPIRRMVMQVLEDAICNWQKTPNIYIKFSG